MPSRLGGICALLAFVTFTIGNVAGGLAQPDAYSFANDDISDLGALSANSAWLYNQVAANLSGLLVALVGLALWRALSPDLLGRVGSAALVTTGVGYFTEGFFRLDCRGIDSGCRNLSWHAHAHKIESSISAALLLVTPFILAFAFRPNRDWHGAWLPTLLAVPVAIVIAIPFSALGAGAATRATSWTWFIWIAFIGTWLLRSRGPSQEAISPNSSA